LRITIKEFNPELMIHAKKRMWNISRS